ncbi:unnamed protein product [Spirodela intermedia]|uniref:PRONE domain-containing protein n=1 Tax=Spirodela intermedia TaxID=51605 RepID=A0A7I8J146_SPIIN|nr:unnamed protein product [Spirodela intermedia]CAA6663533.1 unnamed protein product [Spirodela intermedia]
METMKERFAKLLLGQDMSGGRKGFAPPSPSPKPSPIFLVLNILLLFPFLSFHHLRRAVETGALAPRKKAMWRREMDWLLRVTNSIVMVTRPRSDIYMNLPALRKLDDMVLGMLEGFRDTEFWYIEWGVLLVGAGVDKSSSFSRPSFRQEEKWWLPCPKQSRGCANQILKAAKAINCGVLAEMEIPDTYMENLPKSGKSCLRENIYCSITAKHFFPECLLDSLGLSSEQSALAIANNLEAAKHVWRRKDQKRYQNNEKDKKSWSGKVKALAKDSGRRQTIAERAEALLEHLKLRYPQLPPTVLGMNKIQYNKDVGLSIIESYSRIIESLGFSILARINDVIYADDAVKRCLPPEKVSLCYGEKYFLCSIMNGLFCSNSPSLL